MMTLEDKSFLRLDFIHAMLNGNGNNYCLDRIAVHHSLRDARKILEDFEKRILGKQALTEEQLAWLDWFSYLTTYFIRSRGELPGQWLLIDGVWSFELPGTKKFDIVLTEKLSAVV